MRAYFAGMHEKSYAHALPAADIYLFNLYSRILILALRPSYPTKIPNTFQGILVVSRDMH